MSNTMTNGKPKEQALTRSDSLPAISDNPFLRPAWDKPVTAELSMPLVPGVTDRLTKKQKAILEEGGAHLLTQHMQHLKAGYALGASAHIEDLASRAFTRVATNMAIRTTNPLNPPEAQAYLNFYMDAALRRFGPELLQIASDHHRTQNQIASAVIEIDEESVRGFWAKLLNGLGGRS